MSAAHRPDYLVRIGGQQLSPADATPLIALRTHAGKNDGAGVAMLRLGADLARPVHHGDKVRVEMAIGGGPRTPVFEGTLVAIEPGVDLRRGSLQLTLRAHDAIGQLIASGRRSRSFENQTFGDIVRQHAADAGISTATVEDGARVAHLYMHRQTAYEHCLALAGRAGFDLYAAENGLTFASFRRSAADHTIAYGADVLRIALHFHPLPAGVTVAPESPASSAGDDTATWLVKDSSAHAATQGEADVAVRGDPMLRTRDNADAAAQAAFAQARRLAMHAELDLAGGRAAIKLGQAVRIEQAPDARLNRLYEVLAVTHTLDRSTGFRTRLELAALGDPP